VDVAPAADAAQTATTRAQCRRLGGQEADPTADETETRPRWYRDGRTLERGIMTTTTTTTTTTKISAMTDTARASSEREKEVGAMAVTSAFVCVCA